MESRCDRHHRSGIRGHRCATIRPGPRSRRCATTGCICRPKCRSAGWIFRHRVNRLIGLWWLAKILYPERFPEDLRDADAGFLYPLLSRDADARRKSTMYLRAGIDSLAAHEHLPLRRARICDCHRGADRGPAAGAHRRPLSGQPRRPPQRALCQGGRPPRRRGAGGRKRDLAGARAARDRGDAGGCGARGRRHRVSGAVSQSAGLAGYSGRFVGRGARRRGRHLSFAQRVRDPGGRLRRRADRGRDRSMRSARRCARAIRSWCWC